MDVQGYALSHKNKAYVWESNFDSALGILLRLEAKSETPSDSFIAEWIEQQAQAQSMGYRMSLIEYTAFQSIHRQWARLGLGRYQITTSQIENILTITYYQLMNKTATHRLVDAKMVLNRLPNHILLAHPRDERLIHQALFIQKSYSFVAAIQQLWTDYYFEKQDLIWLVVLIAPILIGSWVSVLFYGLLLGYVFCSYTEYLIHRHVAHSESWQRRLLKRLRSAGHDFSIAHLEHSIHHGSVNKNYILPFSDITIANPQLRAAAYKKRKEKAESFVLKNYGEEVLSNLRKGNYGTTNPNVRRTHFAFLPVTIFFAVIATAAAALVGLDFLLLFFLGFTITSQQWITTSCYYHPLFHRRVSELQRQLPPWVMYLFTSRLSRYIARAHKAHHSTGGLKNQNINLGFDVLFGWAPVTIADIAELRKNEALY